MVLFCMVLKICLNFCVKRTFWAIQIEKFINRPHIPGIGIHHQLLKKKKNLPLSITKE